ncbi:S-adenosyl-L-methionine-dependent methyltransferase [Tuber magnatum]|uniref:S-adenosyl-L-methionine-dependent methyltransferase n=1 Tax=Tuber magnatum TaxID=42249 RepID=A0A317SV49_9PEZI|nr:S-adenosyl-L-methionine-dependent methyltransferase [Tuber magnatum]
MSRPNRPIKRIPTVDAYNQWADVYDRDGNILQLQDDEAFNATVPGLLRTHPPIRILDLGCGTGRNTAKLYRSLPEATEIVAMDVSEGMMSKAKSRIATEPQRDVKITWVLHNIDAGSQIPQEARGVDAVVCTLVMEHLRLDVFFGAAKEALKKGGWMYLTNMHPEQGLSSRAGFVANEGDQEIKIQGVSFNHSIESVLKAAGGVGLRLLGEVEERGVDNAEHAQQLGKRAEKWIGIKMHVAMTFCLDLD